MIHGAPFILPESQDGSRPNKPWRRSLHILEGLPLTVHATRNVYSLLARYSSLFLVTQQSNDPFRLRNSGHSSLSEAYIHIFPPATWLPAGIGLQLESPFRLLSTYDPAPEFTNFVGRGLSSDKKRKQLLWMLRAH